MINLTMIEFFKYGYGLCVSSETEIHSYLLEKCLIYEMAVTHNPSYCCSYIGKLWSLHCAGLISTEHILSIPKKLTELDIQSFNNTLIEIT